MRSAQASHPPPAPRHPCASRPQPNCTLCTYPYTTSAAGATASSSCNSERAGGGGSSQRCACTTSNLMHPHMLTCKCRLHTRVSHRLAKHTAHTQTHAASMRPPSTFAPHCARAVVMCWGGTFYNSTTAKVRSIPARGAAPAQKAGDSACRRCRSRKGEGDPAAHSAALHPSPMKHLPISSA